MMLSTKKLLGYTKIGRIDIMDNCFIGDSTIVLPGVTIGPNAIIGAGSVVTKSIPPNSIASGNPARITGTLDDYVRRMKSVMSTSQVFGNDYVIDSMDEAKREEIVRSCTGRYGFLK